MKKTSLILTVILLMYSLSSQAKQVLSKELILSFQQVSQQWQLLEKDFPELNSSLDDLDIANPEKLITTIKSSAAYPKVKLLLAKSSFDSLEEYYGIAMRIMGGIMAHQMKGVGQLNTDSMGSMLKNNIEQMKASNAPSAMVTEMEQQLAKMESNIRGMKAAMKHTSAVDKQFISDNAQWIMSILEQQ